MGEDEDNKSKFSLVFLSNRCPLSSQSECCYESLKIPVQFLPCLFEFMARESRRIFGRRFKQRHPTTVFLSNNCSKEQIFPRNFKSSRKAKNLLVSVLFVQDIAVIV